MPTMFKHLLPISIVALCVSARADEFLTGADISWVQQQEDRGVRFSDAGREQDILAILKDHGFGAIRLRVFHNPKAEDGYSADGYCDLAHTLVMARRVKAAGMKLLIDFHYSDNWADPGKQRKPSAWVDLHGDALANAVHQHTKEVLSALKKQGTPADMVQIGNEINHGILWPDGKAWGPGGWETFGKCLRSGSAAVREVDPSAKIMLHIALGGQNDKSRVFLDRAIAEKVDFDLIGQSYYPKWHGTLDDLRSNLTDLARRYDQPIIVVEYSAPNIREINQIVRDLPDGKGLGTFIWEPTKWHGGVLFDREGRTTETIDLYVDGDGKSE